jgi:hypothetical protein
MAPVGSCACEELPSGTDELRKPRSSRDAHHRRIQGGVVGSGPCRDREEKDFPDKEAPMATEDPTPSYTMVKDDCSVQNDLTERISQFNDESNPGAAVRPCSRPNGAGAPAIP